MKALRGGLRGGWVVMCVCVDIDRELPGSVYYGGTAKEEEEVTARHGTGYVLEYSTTISI